MLKMEKVAEGVYRYAGELESSDGIPLVGVHLWHDQFEKRELFQFNGERPRGKYFSNLEKLWGISGNRNIVLFEESKSGGVPVSVAEKVAKVRGNGDGIYVVPTDLCRPDPYSSSWENVCDFIGEMSDSIDVTGGYIWKSDLISCRGCLGVALYEFRAKGLTSNLVEGCCFT